MKVSFLINRLAASMSYKLQCCGEIRHLRRLMNTSFSLRGESLCGVIERLLVHKNSFLLLVLVGSWTGKRHFQPSTQVVRKIPVFLRIIQFQRVKVTNQG